MVSHNKTHRNIEGTYIRQVRLLLPKTKSGKAFLAGMQKDLHAYLSNFPDSTMDDVYKVFGTPTNAVQYYLKEQDEEDLKQLLSLRKWKQVIYACCITVPIALAAVFSVNIWYWHNVKQQVLTNITEKTNDNTFYGLGDEHFWKKIP